MGRVESVNDSALTNVGGLDLIQNSSKALRASAGIVFTSHLTRVPICSQRDETCMPQMIVRRPFHVLELAHQDWLQPTAFFHFVSGQTLTPASASGLRDVCEWALGDLQPAEPSKQLVPRRLREADASSSDVLELARLVAAEHQRVEVPAAMPIS